MNTRKSADRGIIGNLFGLILFWLIWLILKLWTSLFFPGSWVVPGKREGLSNQPQIVYARHTSRNDIPLVAMALPATHRVLYISRKGLKMMLWLEASRWLLNLVEGKYVVLVSRPKKNQSPDKAESEKEAAAINVRALRQIHRAIKDRWPKFVVIFPEGATLPKDQSLNPYFVRLAEEHNLPLRPINIIPRGCYGRKNGEKPWRILLMQAKDSFVRVGKPFRAEALRKMLLDEGVTKPTYEQMAQRAMEIADGI